MFKNHKNNNNINEISHSYSKTSQHHPYYSHHKSACPTRLISCMQRSQTLSSLPVSIPSSFNKKPTASVAQGHRFPYTWQIVINAAVSEGLSESQAHWQAKKFRDYWQAKSGKEALRVDWQAP